MTPIKYSIKDDITRFHYKFSELREWYSLGVKYGDVGMILWSRKENMLTYKCFGTIDNPMTSLVTFSIFHHPMLGGEMPTDEQFCTPPEPISNLMSSSFFILDLNKL